MYPILFDSKATTFTTNGIGRLADATSCKVVEERNGSYELEMEYPTTGLHFSDVKNGNIIYAKPFQNGSLQAFRIYRVEKKIKNLAQVYARHISYQMTFIPVQPSFTATSASSALSGLKSHATESCPFSFSTDVVRAGTFAVEKPDSLRALLGGQDGSVLDTFHGEYEWNNYQVILHESRGSNNGVTITYGKNLIDLTQEENIENTVTGIYPYWKKDGGQTTDGHTIHSGKTSEWDAQPDLVPAENDVYIYTDHGSTTKEDGTITYTPGYKIGDGTKKLTALPFLKDDDARLLNAVTYIELDEKIVYSSNASNYPFKRSVVKDFTQIFDGAPSQEQLREYTNQYISENKIGVPAVNLKVKFINLFETPGYKDVAQLQSVKLCDTVTVVFPKLGVNTESKVIKTDYDVLKERYNEIEIGDSTSTLSSTLSDQLKQVSYMPTTQDAQKMIDRATGVLNTGTRGHVIINRNSQGFANEILFLDNENIESAANVLRINMNGIGFSSTGYVGPYYQSWTNDGHLTLGGINDSYGTLEILDENAKPTLMVDKEGLKLLALDYVGYLYEGAFYTDATHQQEITKKKNRGYYDRVTSKLYKWDGTAFVQDTKAGVIASMSHDGMTIKQGEIDILMNENTGFHADGSKIQLGNFIVKGDSRQVFQSIDNNGATGMSGIIKDGTQMYLWAGFYSDNNYGLAVNANGAYTMNPSKSRKFCIGETLEYLDARVKQLQEEIDDLSPTPSSSGGSSGGDIGGYEDIPPGSQH